MHENVSAQQEAFPIKLFTFTEPQNRSIDPFYVAQKVIRLILRLHIMKCLVGQISETFSAVISVHPTKQSKTLVPQNP